MFRFSVVYRLLLCSRIKTVNVVCVGGLIISIDVNEYVFVCQSSMDKALATCCNTTAELMVSQRNKRAPIILLYRHVLYYCCTVVTAVHSIQQQCMHVCLFSTTTCRVRHLPLWYHTAVLAPKYLQHLC